MTQTITQAQLDFFNQNFKLERLQTFREFADRSNLLPEYFEFEYLEDDEICHGECHFRTNDKTSYLIVSKNHEYVNYSKEIKTLKELEQFILNEMNDFPENQKSKQTPTFEDKLKKFNKHFNIKLIENKSYYQSYPKLTLYDMERPIIELLKIDKTDTTQATRLGCITSSRHVIFQGTEFIKEVRSNADIEHFIQYEMNHYL